VLSSSDRHQGGGSLTEGVGPPQACRHLCSEHLRRPGRGCCHLGSVTSGSTVAIALRWSARLRSVTGSLRRRRNKCAVLLAGGGQPPPAVTSREKPHVHRFVIDLTGYPSTVVLQRQPADVEMARPAAGPLHRRVRLVPARRRHLPGAVALRPCPATTTALLLRARSTPPPSDCPAPGPGVVMIALAALATTARVPESRPHRAAL